MLAIKSFRHPLVQCCSRLIAVCSLVTCTLVAIAMWWSASEKLQGTYQLSGKLQLSNGQLLDLSHSLHVNGKRFHAVTRQGDTIIETSGVIKNGFGGHYQLLVEEGDLIGLGSETDTELVFNVLYSRRKGSVIHLSRVGHCLSGFETRQVYCPLAPL
jgi:hypothetical protein